MSKCQKVKKYKRSGKEPKKNERYKKEKKKA